MLTTAPPPEHQHSRDFMFQAPPDAFEIDVDDAVPIVFGEVNDRGKRTFDATVVVCAVKPTMIEVAAMSRTTCSPSETSAGTNIDSPPSSSISWTVSSPPSGSTSDTTTRAPSPGKRNCRRAPNTRPASRDEHYSTPAHDRLVFPHPARLHP